MLTSSAMVPAGQPRLLGSQRLVCPRLSGSSGHAKPQRGVRAGAAPAACKFRTGPTGGTARPFLLRVHAGELLPA